MERTLGVIEKVEDAYNKAAEVMEMSIVAWNCRDCNKLSKHFSKSCNEKQHNIKVCPFWSQSASRSPIGVHLRSPVLPALCRAYQTLLCAGSSAPSARTKWRHWIRSTTLGYAQESPARGRSTGRQTCESARSMTTTA